MQIDLASVKANQHAICLGQNWFEYTGTPKHQWQHNLPDQ